jgi:hypothetical protein
VLEPGRLRISAENYHADRSAVSKSWLDRIDRSPAHLRAYLDGLTKADTPALVLGSLTHCAILEPDLLDAVYAVSPRVDRRTKAGKEAYAEWEASLKGQVIVTADQMEHAKAMRDSVYKHRAASGLLGIGEREATVCWVDAETGERCKARADLLREGCIVDVKTTQDARPAEFAKSIVNFRYDVQDAHYSAGFNLDRFVWIAVEKEYPHGVAVYISDTGIRRRGQSARARNLNAYAECQASGNWPAYPDIVNAIELPRWALNGA